MKRVKCINAGQGLNIKKNVIYEVEREISEGFEKFYELKGVQGAKLKSRFVEVSGEKNT